MMEYKIFFNFIIHTYLLEVYKPLRTDILSSRLENIS